MIIDPAKTPSAEMYRWMIGAIVPRPIAFVSTINPEGIGNLAPFSFFNAVSSDPPCLMISVARKGDGCKKDTLLNIEATRQFVVNIVTESMAVPMNNCSADYPYGIDEMQKVGLHGLPSLAIKPLRVAESPVQFECELYSMLEIGETSAGSTTLVVGRIVMAHVSEHVLEQTPRGARIAIEKLKPLARLGGLSYGLTSGVFDLPRPKA